MKSYKRNITTASLRSASSKRSRRNIISQVTHTSKDFQRFKQQQQKEAHWK